MTVEEERIPDGDTVNFRQRKWQICKREVKQMSCHMLPVLNSTAERETPEPILKFG